MRHTPGAMLRRTLMTGCLLVPALLACDGGAAPSEPMTRATFVQVIVELRKAAVAADSQSVFEARRAEILRAAGVTDSALLEYARVHAGQLDYMAALWDTIDARLNTFQEDTLR